MDDLDHVGFEWVYELSAVLPLTQVDSLEVNHTYLSG